MKLYIMIKSIIIQTLKLIGLILLFCLIVFFVCLPNILKQNPDISGILQSYVFIPLAIAGIILIIIMIISIFISSIKEKYETELKYQELPEKEFEVEYTVTYSGTKTVKAKDKSLISMRNFDKRTEKELSKIKLVKIKKVK